MVGIKSFFTDCYIDLPSKVWKDDGHPAYYVGGKLFASLYMDGVCVKIPETLVKELLKKDGIEPFTPMNRKMREWILINREKLQDYLEDRDIFEESIEFVASIAGLNLKKGN